MGTYTINRIYQALRGDGATITLASISVLPSEPLDLEE